MHVTKFGLVVAGNSGDCVYSDEPADPQRGGAAGPAAGGEGEGVEGEAAGARQAEEGAAGRGIHCNWIT